ncbi:MAG: prephenate dehydrogenase [Treponema sp.]|nr:prephenate dehydrogenase [Treponema sp.]
MKGIEECTIGIAGLGLMGGAFAMALRKCGAASPGNLLAFDIDEKVLAEALAASVIDEGFSISKEMVKRCDLVFLCLNPSTLLGFMRSEMGNFKEGALITDIAGIKGKICGEMEKTLRPDLDFIPGHPMAGVEKGGFSNAHLVSFKDKNYILTPLKKNRKQNLEFFKNLIRRLGFGRITETTAAEHDSKIAFTSQLCHVIAAALVDCEDDSEITRFGGGSFEDLTRIAMLNTPMWTEIFLENKHELLKRIGQFEGSLGKLKKYIMEGDMAVLAETLNQVREKRIGMS